MNDKYKKMASTPFGIDAFVICFIYAHKLPLFFSFVKPFLCTVADLVKADIRNPLRCLPELVKSPPASSSTSLQSHPVRYDRIRLRTADLQRSHHVPEMLRAPPAPTD